MKDQSQMKSQSIMNQKPSRILNQPPHPQLMKMNPQTLMMNQPPPPPQQVVQGMAQPQQQQQQMMNQRSYGMWPPPPMDRMNFPNPMQQQQGFAVPKPPRNWKGQKGIDKRKDMRRKEKPMMAGGSSSGSNVGPPVAVGGALGGVIGASGGGGGYQPPTLNELQHQNRVKTKRFYPKKKFNRYAPYAHAPRNTTSFIIRAKKSGGIASLVSPYPVTPAVLPTPIFSPSREVLGDTAKEEWGVDGYGSMKGLIRLRSPGNEADGHDEDEEDEGGSSESDVEEHVEVERRLDHDLSRFEMIYPNYGVDYNNVLENRVDDQDSHIAQLEDENLILKERLFLMEREFDDLRRRLQFLERQNNVVSSEFLEEVVENVSENESEGRDDEEEEEQDHEEEVMEENNEEEGGESGSKEQPNQDCEAPEPENEGPVKDHEEEVMEENNEQEGGESDSKEQPNQDCNATEPENEGPVKDMLMEECVPKKDMLMKECVPRENEDDHNTDIQSKDEEFKDDCSNKSLDGPETAEIAKEQA